MLSRDSRATLPEMLKNVTFRVDRIGGSRGRALRVQILLFRHTKYSKRNRLGSRQPHYEVNVPPREILDPPLNWLKHNRYANYFVSSYGSNL